MTDSSQNTNQSAEGSAAAGTGLESATMTLAPELGPNGNPVNPPAGDDSPEVDTDFILNTMFGDGSAEPPANSSEGQGKGSNSPDGQSQEGSLAPPQAAPTANGEEGSPQPGPSSTPQDEPNKQASEAERTAQTGQGNAQPSPSSEPASALSVEDRLKLASVNALQEQNAQLIARLQQMEGGQQQQPQGQGQQQPGSPQPAEGQEPPLRLTVPDALMQAIFDENPQTSKQGLDLLITAVAQNAVNAALARVGPLIDQKMAAVTQHIEAGKQVNAMEEAYFERFPTHKNELFRSLIQQVVDEKFRQFPHAKWDELMIDSVGQTVNQRLQTLGIDASAMTNGQQPSGQNGQGQQQANGGGNARPKPAPMLDSGNRRTDGKVPKDDGDFISSTFG